MLRQLLTRAKTVAKKAVGAPYHALDRLRADHMEVERLLIQLRISQDAKERKRLLSELRAELAIHMRIEEEILYPACAVLKKLDRPIEKARKDHQMARGILDELKKTNPADAAFGHLVTQLTLKLERHVYLEENKIFKGLHKHMNKDTLRQLSENVLAAYADVEGRKAA